MNENLLTNPYAVRGDRTGSDAAAVDEMKVELSMLLLLLRRVSAALNENENALFVPTHVVLVGRRNLESSAAVIQHCIS